MWRKFTNYLNYCQPAEYIAINGEPEEKNPVDLSAIEIKTEIVAEDVLKTYAKWLTCYFKDPLSDAYKFGILSCFGGSLTGLALLATLSSPVTFTISSLATICLGVATTGGATLSSCYCCVLDLKIEKSMETLFQEGRLRHLLDSSGKGIFQHIFNRQCSSELKLNACKWLIKNGAILDWDRKDICESALFKLFLLSCRASEEKERKNYLKMAKLFLENGWKINEQDNKGTTLIGAISRFPCESGKLEITSVILFCEFLIKKGADFSWIIRDSDCFTSVLSNIFFQFNQFSNLEDRKGCIKIAQVYLSYPKEIDKILEFSAYRLVDRLHGQNSDDRATWFSLIPSLKPIGKIQNRIKILYHALPPLMQKGSGYDLNGLRLEGFYQDNIMLVSQRFEKLLLNFIDSKLKNYCRQETRNLIEQSLFSLSDPYALENYLANREMPLLIPIGGVSHSAYMWIKGNTFILIDTGGIAIVEEFRGSRHSCIYGTFDGNLFTLSVFQELRACNELDLNNPDYLKKIKKILSEDLKINPEKSLPFSSRFQRAGVCARSSKTMFIACIHFLLESERKFINEDVEDLQIGENVQLSKLGFKRDFFYLLYEVLWPLHLINQTKLFGDVNFLKESKYLPFVKDLYNECKDGGVWHKLFLSFSELAIEPIREMAQNEYQAALNRLESTIDEMGKNSVEE